MSLVNMLKSTVCRLIKGPFDSRQLEVLSGRSHFDKQQFADHFLPIKVEENIPNSVWDILVSEHSIEGFKPFPSDDIIYMYGIADEDFEDFVSDLIELCDREFPAKKELDCMDPIESVFDLVKFISSCSPNQNRVKGIVKEHVRKRGRRD